jgi:hypothetical protein
MMPTSQVATANAQSHSAVISCVPTRYSHQDLQPTGTSILLVQSSDSFFIFPLVYVLCGFAFGEQRVAAASRPATYRSDICTAVFWLRKIPLCDSAWLRSYAYFPFMQRFNYCNQLSFKIA